MKLWTTPKLKGLVHQNKNSMRLLRHALALFESESTVEVNGSVLLTAS